MLTKCINLNISEFIALFSGGNLCNTMGLFADFFVVGGFCQIAEVTTDVAPQRAVWPGNRWSETDPTREYTLSPTQANTTTLCQLTGTP
mgnify:CR=1 FL=1